MPPVTRLRANRARRLCPLRERACPGRGPLLFFALSERVACRLAGRAAVTVFERGKAGSGASHAAAGMLAACCEAEPGEEALVALGRESQARWPGFAAELLRATTIDVE